MPGYYSGNLTSLENTTGHMGAMHPMALNRSTNEGVDFKMPLVNGHTKVDSHTYTNGFSHDAHDVDDMCKPKYFIFNSQVFQRLIVFKENLFLRYLRRNWCQVTI